MNRLIVCLLLVFCTNVLAQSGGSGNSPRSGGGGGGAKGSDQWGAISYDDEDGQWGLSYNYASRNEAERIARDQCGRRNCKTVVWFKNACGAVAQSSTYWGVGEGDNRQQAEREALRSCGQRSCEVVAWGCSDH